VIDGLAPVIDRIDGELRLHARADPRVKVLTTLPGVGQFTALVMLAEIGDITRFGSARKLASWAGLTPTVRGSDRTVRHGHISKMVCAGGMVPLRRPGGVRWRWLEDSICTGVS
jgi:transposase